MRCWCGRCVLRGAVTRSCGCTRTACGQSVLMDTLPKVVRLAFPRLRLAESSRDQFVRLPNRSEIWFGGLDAGERADKILGKEFSTIYFNECSEIGYGGG